MATSAQAPPTDRPLADHELFSTCDLDEARIRIAAQFCDHYLGLTSADGELDVCYRTAPIGDSVSINYLRYGDEVRITPGTFDDFFLVQIPLAGTAHVAVGAAVAESDTAVASIGSPTEPVDMIWSDGCEQLLVYIRRGLVEDLMTPSLGERCPVVFDPRLDLTAPAGSAWLDLVKLAVDDIDSGRGSLTSTLVAGHFEHTLVSALLASQPHSLSDAPRQSVGSRAVRHVVDLMEASPAVPWRLADLAADVGVSARALQGGFRSELGTTPMAYLRRIRLHRANHDLVEADPASTSVADVAARWGFGHLGRFAAVYRQEFGELPSATLAR